MQRERDQGCLLIFLSLSLSRSEELFDEPVRKWPRREGHKWQGAFLFLPGVRRVVGRPSLPNHMRTTGGHKGEDEWDFRVENLVLQTQEENQERPLPHFPSLHPPSPNTSASSKKSGAVPRRRVVAQVWPCAEAACSFWLKVRLGLFKSKPSPSPTFSGVLKIYDLKF